MHSLFLALYILGMAVSARVTYSLFMADAVKRLESTQGRYNKAMEDHEKRRAVFMKELDRWKWDTSNSDGMGEHNGRPLQPYKPEMPSVLEDGPRLLSDESSIIAVAACFWPIALVWISVKWFLNHIIMRETRAEKKFRKDQEFKASLRETQQMMDDIMSEYRTQAITPDPALELEAEDAVIRQQIMETFESWSKHNDWRRDTA